MTRPWLYKIDVSREWAESESGLEDGFRAVAKSAVRQIRHLGIADEELASIVEELEDIALAEDCTADDFDLAWEALYDWADSGKQLWINTIGKLAGAAP